MRISDWSSDVCSSDLLAAGDEGFVISQGATEMVISALYKTRKARLVERFDLRLVNAELQFSKNSMSGRAVVDGAVRPSDFLLVGAVTELNSNILTGGAGLWVACMGAGMRGAIGRASCREMVGR